ncbi:hypothetical protein LTR37_007874 [Vermiconidia calcicola]|uniref:Uncharacterized protein n=1 Tax=Vermiconidia calcicola TaxID=1690605 RepID=A0ACC3NC94_9PEZI|nr:hypothetical protein LTR37_007874 [Vermiconidia calcicola]
MGKTAGQSIARYTIKPDTTTDDLRNHAFSQLRLDPTPYNMQLHEPDKCKEGFTYSMLNGNSTYEHTDGPDVLVVYEHLIPKDDEPEVAKSEPTTAAPRTSSPNAGVAPSSFTSAPEQKSNKTQKRKLSPTNDDDATPANSKQNKLQITSSKGSSDLQYIRFGTFPSIEPKTHAGITLDVLAVGAVNIEKGKVKFLKVDMWTVTGVQLGYCDKGKEFDASGETDYELGPDFKKLTSKEALRDALQGKAKSNKHRLTTTPAQPVLTKSKAKTSIIVGVILFKDHGVHEGALDFENNFQVDIDSTDTYAIFKDFMLNGDGDFGGVKALMKDVSPLGGWDVEIYVLPQVEESTTTYSWTHLHKMLAVNWLDAKLVGKYGRKLYIEVHIVPKNREEAQAKKTKTKLTEDVEQPKKKKKKVFDVTDEAGVEEAQEKKKKMVEDVKQPKRKGKKVIGVPGEAGIENTGVKQKKGKKVIDETDEVGVEDAGVKNKGGRKTSKAGMKSTVMLEEKDADEDDYDSDEGFQHSDRSDG